jgi:hypothetical protein
LDPAEHLGRDQRFVGAGVLDPVPLHDADVDRVGEDLGEALPGDGCGGLSPLAPVGEALVGQFARQTLQGPFPGGVALEGAGKAPGRDPHVDHTAHGSTLLRFQSIHRVSIGPRLQVPAVSGAITRHGRPARRLGQDGHIPPAGQLGQAKPDTLGVEGRPDGTVRPAGVGLGGGGERQPVAGQCRPDAALAAWAGHHHEQPEGHAPGPL